ncbi:MAG: hypothetical protein V2A58_17355 [Planctomycetota bacterium]
MTKRRKLHSQLILDVALAFAVVVLLFIVSDFYYERKLLQETLEQHLVRETEARLLIIRAEVERSGAQVLSREGLEGFFRNDFAKLLKLSGDKDHLLAAFDANAALIIATGSNETPEDFDRTLIFEAIQTRKARSVVETATTERSIVSITPVLNTTAEDRPVIGALAYRAPLKPPEIFTVRLAWSFIFTRLVGFALILIVLVIVIAAVTQKLIVSPIQALIVQQHAATQGDLRRQKGSRPNNEIGDMFVMLDRIVDTLDEKTRKLNKLQEALPKTGASSASASHAPGQGEPSFLPDEKGEENEPLS